MPGMGSNLQTNNPVVVSAFHTELLHQLVVILLVLAVLSLIWNLLRTARYGRFSSSMRAPTSASGAPAGEGGDSPAATLQPEPVARKVLRFAFGAFWILDGVLQLQSAMPLGLPTGVLQPSASSSPSWVSSVVNLGVTIWTKHPVQAAASVVWIQVGVGALLLLAPRGGLSRLAGAASVAWGLVVWVFGEGFGGVFAHGSSWMFGLPGAVLFYCAAGALIALPERVWSTPALGRWTLRSIGVFLLGMAVLQAWPGRGFWQGSVAGHDTGSLTAMVQQMATTSQPSIFSSILRDFAAFDASHGWAVNLFVVVALAAIGAGFCVASERVARYATYAAVVVFLADWLLVEDLGFFGGVGTDPNSMVPLLTLAVSGYLAMVRVPAAAPAEQSLAEQGAQNAQAKADELVGAPDTPWWGSVSPQYLTRAIAAAAAFAIVLVGAVPMASAAVNPNADPILAVAADGTPNSVNTPAPPFSLVDQSGDPVTLSDLRGRIVVLTFLDPVCTSDCPVIAKEFRQSDQMLGSDARKVVFVAVVANPLYRARPFLLAFDRQEGLQGVSNWLYLTGSVAQLDRVWDRYGVVAEVEPAGAMVAHSEIAYLIDSRGRTREVLSSEPANGLSAASSYSVYLDQAIEQVLHR